MMRHADLAPRRRRDHLHPCRRNAFIEIVMAQVRAMSRFDVSARLGELSAVPTLVVSAMHDRIARPEYGRALAAAIPGARYVEIRDAGHGVTIQLAAKTNELLAGHWESAASRQPSAGSF